MKTLKECYQILLDIYIDVHKHKDYSFGICSMISVCKAQKLLTADETEKLNNHFLKNKPNLFDSEFYHKTFNSFDRCSNRKEFQKEYWWSRDIAGMERRKVFLKKQIDSFTMI